MPYKSMTMRWIYFICKDSGTGEVGYPRGSPIFCPSLILVLIQLPPSFCFDRVSIHLLWSLTLWFTKDEEMLKYHTLELSNIIKVLQQISLWFASWHLGLKWLWLLIYPCGFNFCDSQCEGQKQMNILNSPLHVGISLRSALKGTLSGSLSGTLADESWKSPLIEDKKYI